MGRSKQLRKQRTRMFNQNPNCPNCGVSMILSDIQDHEASPDNLCTIEHKYGKLNKNRKKREPFSHTILCLKCNNRKGRQDELDLGIEKLRERSKNHKNE